MESRHWGLPVAELELRGLKGQPGTTRRGRGDEQSRSECLCPQPPRSYADTLTPDVRL